MFKMYMTISVLNVLAYALQPKLKNEKDREMIDEELNDLIDSVRYSGNFKLAYKLEHVTEAGKNGNKIPLYMVMAFLSFTPIIHIFNLCELVKNLIKHIIKL